MVLIAAGTEACPPSSARPARWATVARAVDRRLAALGAVAVVGGAEPAPPRPQHRAVARFAVAVAVARRRLMAGRRGAAYERELPAVLESVAAQLRAGGSLAQAIVDVKPAESGRSDLAEHWRRLGAATPVLGLETALAEWAETAGARPAVRLAAGALALAAATGGSPARAVDGVASTLRSRLALAEEVRALSSQARASAAVIAVAPLVFGTLAGLTDRRVADFFVSPAGLVLVGLGLALDAAGAWWMHRLCRAAA